MTATSTTSRTRYLTMLALLTSVLILLEVTNLGYIKTPGLEFTIMQVPVIIGAIVMGPGAGAILGTVFGLTSFLQCVTGKSVFGAQLLMINPVGTFLTTVPTRALMGLVCGLIFLAFTRRSRSGSVPYIVSSLAAALTNTVLFMGALVLFFYNTDYIQGFVTALGSPNALVFVLAFVGIQGLLEAIICAIAGSAVSRALVKYFRKN